jgi:hypothetical protein
MTSPRGAILLEMMLALSLFLAAAGFTLLAIQGGLQASVRAAEHGQALNLASSTIAAIEAGVEQDEDPIFEVEVERSASGHAGLVHVEVRVLRRASEKVMVTLDALLPSESSQ